MSKDKLLGYYHKLGAENGKLESVIAFSHNTMDVGWARYRVIDIKNIRQRILNILYTYD